MDTLKQRIAKQKEDERKQKAEESFHNGINEGREILKPLEKKTRMNSYSDVI